MLPNYDEYIVGYTDRSAVFDASHTTKLDSRGNILSNHTMVIDGQIVGTWTRTIKKDAVVITSHLFTALTDAENHAFATAASHYGKFLDIPVILT